MIASLLGVVAVAFIISILMFLIWNNVSGIFEKSDLYLQKLTETGNDLITYVNEKVGFRLIRSSILKTTEIQKMLRNNVDTLTNVLSVSTSFLSDVFLVPLYIYFMLYFNNFFLEFLYKLFSNSDKSVLDSIINGIYGVIHNYLKGLLIVMFIVGVLNGIGLLVLGIEDAFFWGFMGAILLLIPYIGITIGSLIPALVALATKDSPWYAVGVLAVFIGVQMLEGNLITPKIVGSKVSINSFVAILAFLVFGKLWGLSGLVLAMPLTAMIKVILDHHPRLKTLGFIMGVPADYHLNANASQLVSNLYETEHIKKVDLTEKNTSTTEEKKDTI